jgi:hypothetical protein
MRLRALVEGRATLVQRHGKPTIDYPAVQNRLRITPEQEAALGSTGRALAQAAGARAHRGRNERREGKITTSSPLRKK